MTAGAGVAELVAAVPDPELPMLTIGDLGVLRRVDVDGAGRIEVTITPTYTGCPALEAIRDDIGAVLAAAGHREVTVHTVLAPPWSTDWITPAGRRALAEHGIAPPGPAPGPAGPVFVPLLLRRPPDPVCCPLCGSPDTREVSRFGSTACTALRTCTACREPFSAVKPL